MFNIFKGKENIPELIKYTKLENWWNESLEEDERKEIKNIISSYNNQLGNDWFKSNFSTTSLNIISAIKNYKLLNKFITVSEKNLNQQLILDQHFYYFAKIKALYKFRDQEDNALSMTIETCNKSTALSSQAIEALKDFHKEIHGNLSDFFLPNHTGYTQLSIIFQKQNKYKEAIELCQQALKQGWGGDWEKRIERYTKKL